MKRKVGIALVVLGVLIVAAPVAVFLWLDGERLESLAVSYFERTGGVEMDARSVTRTIGFVPRIDVDGLSLRRPGIDEPLLEVEHGAVSIVLTSLLFQPIELRDIRVEGANIGLPVDDDGLLYWGRAIGDLLNRLKSAGVRIEGFRASDLRIEGRHTGGRGSATTTIGAIDGTMPAPSQLAFRVEEMTTSIDIAPPLTLAGELELDTLTLDHDGEEPTTVRIDGSGRIADRPLTIAVRGGNPLENDADRREPIDAEIGLGQSRAALRGTLSREADRHVDAGIEIDVVDLGAMPDWHASLQISDPGDAWLFESLSARWADTTIDGRARLERREPRPYLSGRFELAGLGIGSRSGDDEATTDDGSSGFGWLDRLDAVDADVSVTSRDMRLYGLPIDEVGAELHLQDAHLDLPVEGNAFSGRLTANIEIEAGESAPPAHHLSLELDGISTSELLRALEIDHEVEGRVDGAAELDASGAGIASILDTAAGSVQLTMSGGSLSETLARIADQDVVAAVLGSFGGTETTPIRCAIADFAGDSGVLEARTLLVDTGEVKLVGGGEIDVADRRIDLVIRPHAKDFSLLSAAAPIELTGPLTAPDISTDVGEAIASALTPIELGQAEDAPCSRLLEQARANL